MPTFQTSPMNKWVFPDQAIALNTMGVGPLKPIRLPKQDIMMSVDSVHSTWRDQAHKVALDRIKNTKRAEQGMLGKLKMNARSQRPYRPASRSAVPNGVFPGNEYVTSAGLRGGVITTKEGQEWVQKRLNNRIVELDAIASHNFSAGPPPNIILAPQFSVLDTVLQNIFDAFASSKFDSSTVSDLEKLQSEFLKVGSTIDGRDLAHYSDAIEQLYAAVEPYYGQSRSGILGLDRNTQLEYSRTLKYIRKALENLDYFIQEIARTMNEDQAARELVVNKLRERRLGETISSFQAPGAISVEAEEAATVPTPAPAPAPAPVAPAPTVGSTRYNVSF